MALTRRSFIQVLLPLLLILTTLASASPLSRRQTTSLNLTSCAPNPLLISQFSTFSGSATQNPHITFFLTNPNAGAPGKMLCTATLGPGQGNFSGSDFYSCEQAGTGFSYQISTAGEEGRLTLFQYQVCEVGTVNTISHQVIIAAAGGVAMTSYPGEYGGEYSESVTGSANIAVTNVQDVQTINGGQGRLDGLQEMNVTCGSVGPGNVVVKIGSCDLGSAGSGI